jgi:CPA2 family monovalent cation:H+ antiporter-2
LAISHTTSVSTKVALAEKRGHFCIAWQSSLADASRISLGDIGGNIGHEPVMALELAHEGLKDALVILGVAGIVIPAFARFRITPIIGFLLVGILVGPMALGALAGNYPWLKWVTISDTENIRMIGEYGVILLLFSIGLDLSVRRLWRMRRQVFGLGAAELLGCGVVIGLALMLAGYSASAALGLGLALALSSTALVLPLAGTKSAVGRGALSMLLFEDLAIIPIIFLLGALAPQAPGRALDNLLTVLWQGALVVLALLLAGRVTLTPLFGQAARTKNPELFISASLLVVILSSLATAAVGLSPIVGALIAGVMIAETDYQGEVETVIAPFKGLALGVFLVSIGMQVDPAFIASNWAALCLSITGVLTVKAMVTGGLLKFAGARSGVAAETGLLMASPSEMTLIVLSTSVVAQIIDTETAKFWQVVTVIGLLITPLLARIGHDVARRIEVRSSGKELDEDITSTEPRTIIIGFGRVGRLVADMLETHSQAYIAVESNIDTVVSARRDGYPVIFGDVARPVTLNRLGLNEAKALVLTMDEPALMARIVKRVRLERPALTIIARARDADHAAELYLAGASDAVPETLESSLQLSEAVLVDLGMAMGPVIASIHEKRDEFRRTIKKAGQLDQLPALKLHG